MRKSNPAQSGFTLVELVVVIILVSIVSLAAYSRYMGTSGFSVFTAQEQAISVIRQVQINRMQSNLTSPLSNTHYVLAISNSCLGSVAGCASGSGEQRSDVVREEGITFSTSPNVNTVAFDLLGNPLDSAASGVTITIRSNANTVQMCINSQGYVSKGGCA
ncbi:prepilin-type N-terminal cleavage/methylation domain-containing protein [Vibrio tritonius]|uniref:prepilin-type N-terminal cleavage/methylation domain-containing protein n=1 Tax=Vibrio tritonius TaxID=1435069 RepID=UPI0008381C80|nr:prepilin-type N-terminal cleavage/methylation domain-containing protein [Vibrio tritonius]